MSSSIIDLTYKTGHGSNGMELLISEWGSMGKSRPKVDDMLKICQEIEAFRAASYINTEILKSRTTLGIFGIFELNFFSFR